jgi:hypothetical protein
MIIIGRDARRSRGAGVAHFAGVIKLTPGASAGLNTSSRRHYRRGGLPAKLTPGYPHPVSRLRVRRISVIARADLPQKSADFGRLQHQLPFHWCRQLASLVEGATDPPMCRKPAAP